MFRITRCDTKFENFHLRRNVPSHTIPRDVPVTKIIKKHCNGCFLLFCLYYILLCKFWFCNIMSCNIDDRIFVRMLSKYIFDSHKILYVGK